MKSRIAFAAVAALALSACGSSDTAEAPAADEAAPAEAAAPEEVAAAEPAAAPAKGEKPTKEFMVGKWGEDGDCVMAIDVKADGTTDGPFGNWNLEDGVLTMADAPQKVHLTVVDEKTIDSKLDGKGASKMMTRC
jgi:hypothetical protein